MRSRLTVLVAAALLALAFAGRAYGFGGRKTVAVMPLVVVGSGVSNADRAAIEHLVEHLLAARHAGRVVTAEESRRVARAGCAARPCWVSAAQRLGAAIALGITIAAKKTRCGVSLTWVRAAQADANADFSQAAKVRCGVAALAATMRRLLRAPTGPPAATAKAVLKARCPRGTHAAGDVPPTGTWLGCVGPRGGRHGPFVQFSGGHVFARGRYKSGELDGKWQSLDVEGKPLSEALYRGGRIVKATFRFASGAVRRRVTAKLDTTFHEDGKQKRKEGPRNALRREGKWSSWRADGSLAASMHYKAGTLHGRYERFGKAGKKTWQADYKDGLLDGVAFRWRADGSIISEGRYRGGKRSGPWVYYHRDGRTKRRAVTYRAGRLHGKATTWHTDGDKRKSGSYVDGKQHGPWFFFRSGKVVGERTYRAGKLHGPVVTFWASTGKKRGSGSWRDGKQHGVFSDHQSDGRVRRRVTWTNGKLNGRFETWWANGARWTTGMYRSGRRVGRWVTYWDSGRKQIAVRFRNGLRAGSTTRWYKNGRVQAQGQYVAGKRSGTWTFFDRHGQRRSYTYR